MKKKKIYFTMLVFIFLFFVGAEMAITIKIENSAGQYLNVFSYLSKETFFSKSQEEIMKKAGYAFSFLAEEELMVKTFRNQKKMKIMGANENYQYLSGKEMLSGAWFNSLQTERKSKVVVISKAFALQYFGTANAKSNELEIDGLKYKVIGVIKEKGTAIYIPSGNMEAYHKLNIGKSQLWCNLQNKAEVSLLLQRLGIRDGEVSIFRAGEYQRIVKLRIQFIFLLTGIFLAVPLLKRMRKNKKELVIDFTHFMERNYAGSIGKLLKQKKTVWQILSLLLCIGGILSIFAIIRFEWLLPDMALFDSNDNLIEKISHIFEFYIQPYIWVESLYFLNGLNLISLVVFFLILLCGSAVIWMRKEFYSTNPAYINSFKPDPSPDS